MVRITIALCAAALVGACAQPDTTDPEVFGRLDCQSVSTSQATQVQFDQDFAICKARGEAQAEVARSSGGVAYGLGAAIEQSMQYQRAGVAAVKACMTSTGPGYLYMKRSMHDARCEAQRAANAKPQPKPKT